jgi:hypothetical protein
MREKPDFVNYSFDDYLNSLKEPVMGIFKKNNPCCLACWTVSKGTPCAGVCGGTICKKCFIGPPKEGYRNNIIDLEEGLFCETCGDMDPEEYETKLKDLREKELVS